MTRVERRDLIRLVKRVCYFFPALAIAFFALFFPFIVFWKSGELNTLNTSIERQQHGEVKLYGLAYINLNKNYKLNVVLRNKPEIIALGTSRALQFRAEFFKQPSIFYNAALAIRKLRHIQKFLEKLPDESKPKLVILSLDQNFFNDLYDAPIPDSYDVELANNFSPLGLIKSRWVDLYIDYIVKKKFSLETVLANKNKSIGLTAIVRGDGFRVDGSYLGSSFLSDPVKYGEPKFRDTYQRIAEGTARFEHGEKISDIRLREITDLLRYCSDRKIKLVTFLPPYAHEIYQKMKDDGPSKYGYFFALVPSIRPIFQAYNMPLFDYSDLATLGLEDKVMSDGSHPSERVSAVILRRMALENDSVANYVDTSVLDNLLNQSKSLYEIVPKTDYWKTVGNHDPSS